MKLKPFAWSFSRLNNFETCPKRHYLVDLTKEYKDETDSSNYGLEVHKALDKRISKGTKLPMHMAHLEPYAAQVAGATGEVLTEQQLAINKDMRPTGWFDPDAWCRVIVDVAITNDSHAVLIDWKTGKMKDDFTQQKLVGAVWFLFCPNVQTIDLVYYWTKNKKATKERIERKDMREIWATLLPRVMKYKEAYENVNFEPRPSYLCKRYCPVKACPHHGT